MRKDIEGRPGQNPETKELIPTAQALHLAGMFEVGGGVHFSTSATTVNGVKYPYVCPELTFEDKKLEHVLKFQELYGGPQPRKSQRDTSWRWRVKGKKALRMLEAIEPYTPSRRDFIQAAASCYDNDLTFSEKMNIVKPYMRRGDNAERFSHVSPSDYQELVENPYFVGGAFDARGTISLVEDWVANAPLPYGNISPHVSISTQNNALLSALKEKYKGNIEQTYTQGDHALIQGEEVTLKNNSFKWTVTHTKAQTFLADIGPYTPLRSAA